MSIVFSYNTFVKFHGIKNGSHNMMDCGISKIWGIGLDKQNLPEYNCKYFLTHQF